MSTTPPPPPYVPNDIFAHYGRRLIKDFLKERQIVEGAPGPVLPTQPDSVPDAAPPSYPESLARAPKVTVGILGAGMGGLYTALILDDLGIPYKIIEARDRVGGRLFTHKFPNKTGAPYNYYDVGAMRFPDIDSMRRVFRLFDYKPLNTGDLALKAKLKTFYFANDNAFLSYNGVTLKRSAVPTPSSGSDPFRARAVNVPKEYIAVGVEAIVNDVIDPFARELLKDLTIPGRKVGWEKLLTVDKYSTRAYMCLEYEPSPKLLALGLPKGHLSTDVVNWLETFDKSTGWYDRAFSETILEAIAFGWKPDDPSQPAAQTNWYCIDGGSFEIADTTRRYIESKQSDGIQYKTRVTGVSLSANAKSLEVTVANANDGYEKHEFDHVISTIPLPVLRTIDLTNAGLNPMQANAIRQLNYGPSVKIGMQFSSAWWTTGKDKDGKPLSIVGGQSYSDCPLRTVVYPSYGDVQSGKTTTLIASYCWTEDSERLAALANSKLSVLKDLVLRELAAIHNVTIDFLQSQLIDVFPWSWSLDPFTMGAFAFFGPGKFGNVYASLTCPAAKGRLHFAGEAISVRHAWVEGALDSAWRAVFELLLGKEFTDAQREKFFTNWGYNAEWLDDQFDEEAPEAEPIESQPDDEKKESGEKRRKEPSAPVIREPFAMPVPGLPVPAEGKAIDLRKILKNSLFMSHFAQWQATTMV